MSGGPDILQRLSGRHGPLIFDGAMGTEIQKLPFPIGNGAAINGCNEALNLSAPAVIRNIHRSYLAAGADVIETNTFGASR